MFKYSFNLGAIVGGLLIAVKLVAYLLGMEQSMFFESLGYVILAGGIIYGIKGYRDGLLGGYISYEKSLGLGTLIGVASAVLLSFFLYIYLKFVDASVLDTALEAAKEEIYNNEDLTDEQIEASIEALPMFISPGVTAFFSLLVYAFIGFVFSLIISIFMKKPEPFIEPEQ